MEHEDLLSAARTIRNEMPRLLPATGDAPLAQRVGGLVDRMAAGELVDDELFEALTGHEALRRRLDQLLPDNNIVDKGWDGPGYEELPGPGDPVDALYFVCPQGDYRYPVLEVGEDTPLCPVHHIPLVAE